MIVPTRKLLLTGSPVGGQLGHGNYIITILHMSIPLFNYSPNFRATC
jgi:hypothetical protein